MGVYNPRRHVSSFFISYRRQDTSGHAGRLMDRLAAQFGGDRVFMDVQDVRPGQNFATSIEETLAQLHAPAGRGRASLARDSQGAGGGWRPGPARNRGRPETRSHRDPGSRGRGAHAVVGGTARTAHRVRALSGSRDSRRAVRRRLRGPGGVPGRRRARSRRGAVAAHVGGRWCRGRDRSCDGRPVLFNGTAAAGASRSR